MITNGIVLAFGTNIDLIELNVERLTSVLIALVSRSIFGILASKEEIVVIQKERMLLVVASSLIPIYICPIVLCLELGVVLKQPFCNLYCIEGCTLLDLVANQPEC